MFAIAGARAVGKIMAEHTGTDHLETAKCLIAAGADINARDVAGVSCLYHCTTAQCTARSLAVRCSPLNGWLAGWLTYHTRLFHLVI